MTPDRCQLCDHPKWFHILPRGVRLREDQRDDGHAFRPIGGIAGQQMWLEFNVRPMQPKPQTGQLAKKPVRADREQPAAQKKRLA